MSIPSGTKYFIPITVGSSYIGGSFSNFLYQIDLSSTLASDTVLKSHILSSTNISVYDTVTESICNKKCILDLSSNTLLIYFNSSTSTSVDKIFYICVGYNVNHADSVYTFSDNNYLNYWGINELSDGSTIEDYIGSKDFTKTGGLIGVDSVFGNGLNIVSSEVYNSSLLSLSQKTNVSIEFNWLSRLGTVTSLFFQSDNATNYIRLRVSAAGYLTTYIGLPLTNYSQTAATISNSTQYHVQLVYDGNGATNADKVKLYLNGSQVSLKYSGTVPAITDDFTGETFYVGNPGVGASFGVFDELSISSDSKSQTYVLTRYNQLYVSNFYSIGSGVQYANVIQYAVELKCDFDDNIISDDFGLSTDKTFRWITGRPSYNGTGSYPKWEDDTDNTEIWYEGILLKEGLSNPSRRIDIDVSGQYGTLSGINIQILNYNKFFNFIEDNSIHIIGRNVRVFVVLDGKFYQIWNGIVQNLPYDETSFGIQCNDNYKQIHKVMPPNVISVASETDSTDQGDTIPIVIGDVAFTKLVNAGNKPEYIDLVENDLLLSIEYDRNRNTYILVETPSTTKKFKQCGVNQFFGYGIGTGYQIGLKTSEALPFAEHALEEYYLVGIKGTGLDLETASKIVYSYESAYGANGEWQTIVRIHGDLGGLYAADIADHEYDPTTPNSNWWFGIADLSTTMIAADSSITEFVKDDKNNYFLYSYDKNTNQYKRIDHLIDTVGLTGIQGVGYPGIQLMANQMTFDGEISIISGIVPEQYRVESPYYVNTQRRSQVWRYINEDGSYGQPKVFITKNHSENLIDKNVNTYLEATTAISSFDATQHEYHIYLLFPEDKITDDLGDVYVCLDYTVDNPTHAGTVNSYWNISSIDAYGNVIDTYTDSFVYPAGGGTTAGLPLNVYSLPSEYYKGGTSWGEDGYVGNDHFWGRVEGTGANQVIYTEVMKLDETIIADIKKGKISDLILVKLFVKFNSAQTCTLKLYQAGFVCRKKINISDDDIYARVHSDGSGIPGATGMKASVYTAYKTILEQYDNYGYTGGYTGMSLGYTGANWIDYSNLPSVRDDWYVGRQITERKNSYDYLNELCQQSFVGMFPTRRGNRKIVAWRDLTDYTATIGETGIVRDSITNWEKSDPSQVYNDFKCEYSYNQATKKFDRCLIVTHSNESSFPLYTDTSWYNYVQGLSSNSYADAKQTWDIAHNAFDITNTTQQNPTTTQKLYWYYDQSIFDNTEFVGASVDDAAYKFLQNLVVWTGLNKDKCKFALPLNSTNIQLELLDMILFEDGFFTDSVQRKGWITVIEVDVNKHQIKLEVTLEPLELIDYNIIIERNLDYADDQIDESSGTDTIDEG